MSHGNIEIVSQLDASTYISLNDTHNENTTNVPKPPSWFEVYTFGLQNSIKASEIPCF